MKIFLKILIAFYFLSITHTSIADSNNSAESVFTFTHKADNDEKVFVLLEDKLPQLETDKLDLETLNKYQLGPNECLEITTSQFENLLVKVGIMIGFTDGPSRKLTSNKTVCGGLYQDKCQPNHYEIIDEGTVLTDFVMIVADEPNPRDDCKNIAAWMNSKNKKEPLEESPQEKTTTPEEPDALDDTLGTIDDSNFNFIPKENDSVFTITHKANSDENIFIFLQDILPKKEKVLPHNQFIHKYKLESYECLQVTTSQFDSLFVKVGVAGMSSTSSVNKPLCGHSEDNKCHPSNYDIIDTKDHHDYMMNPVNQPNTSKGCKNIAVWMANKNTKTP